MPELQGSSCRGKETRFIGWRGGVTLVVSVVSPLVRLAVSVYIGGLSWAAS